MVEDVPVSATEEMPVEIRIETLEPA